MLTRSQHFDSATPSLSLMTRRLFHFAIRIPALLAVLGILFATTAAAAPGVLHGDDFDHCCQICHLGHMKTLKPTCGVIFHTPAIVYTLICPDSHPETEHQLAGSAASRAPPA